MADVNQKYCKCIQQNVVVSGYNDNGKCACLTCRKKQCDETCGAGDHTSNIVNIFRSKKGPKKIWSRGWCVECLNATLYNETQKKK